MRISIITATLNAEHGLRRTVQSVAEQTYQDREHIIIDGASDDGTRSFLRASSLRWLSEPDDGIANAMNRGLRMATGDYVLFLHAGDEFLDAESLSRAAPQLTGDELISFDVFSLTNDGRKRRLSWRQIMRRLHLKLPFPHQGCFMKRSLFDRIGPFDEAYKIAMDYEFMLRAFARGVTTKRVSEVLSIMPETGISTRRDWPSVKMRLADEQRLQRKHLQRFGWPVYAYWWLYMPYKKFRSR